MGHWRTKWMLLAYCVRQQAPAIKKKHSNNSDFVFDKAAEEIGFEKEWLGQPSTHILGRVDSRTVH